MTQKIDNKPFPTIVFGDIHGSMYWQKVVNENPACRYIFLGDYLDPYEVIPSYQLTGNLKKIIQLKKDYEEDVILLLGNHDLHYIHAHIEPCWRYDYEIEDAAHALFTENIHLFTYAFQVDKWIFTHAGISEKWFLDDFKGVRYKNIAEQLNNPSPEQMTAINRCGKWRGGDRNMVGGIFWADVSELYDPLPGYTQVVGHNRVDDICEYANNGGRIIFCDCLYNKKYLKLDF